MSLWGALAGGFVGTLVLTTMLRAATELRTTRIDLPFLLGTAVTTNRKRAKAVGYLAHFGFGFLFAFGYYAIFRAVGHSGWIFGAILGLIHGVFAGTALVNVLLPTVHPRMGTATTASDSTPILEPPGFFLRNYGPATPVVTVAAHIAYGAIVGGFTALAR
jgi:hypothetical protein